MYHYADTQIPMNDHNKNQLDKIRDYAVAQLSEPSQNLTYSDFILFEKTGSRVEYEAAYTLHRKRLNAFVAMSLSEEDEKWLVAVENALWAICDEFTWALPAHIPSELHQAPEQMIEKLDLFSAGTGFTLSEIYHLLKDRLSPLIKTRIQYEVEHRIIQPYLRTTPKWGANNWSAVCAAGIVASIIYISTQEVFNAAIVPIIESLDEFLSSYPNDGCCLEGVLYQAYGFGHYCYAAQLIREYTSGAINLLTSEKIRRIAEFSQKAYFNSNICVPFADAPHNYNYNIGLAHFLAKEFDTAVPDESYEVIFGDDIRHRFPDFIRNFYWYDEELTPTSQNTGYTFFPDAQWYIAKNKNYSFAAKGGHNAEPHNHNDLGGFVLLKDKTYIIDDLGWPEYYKGYFGEKRYDDACASSKGHSVPIVGGSYQQAGEEYRAFVIAQSENKFTLDLTKAYSPESAESLIRTFLLKENGIQIIDSVTACSGTFSERLITRQRPVIEGNQIFIQNAVITCSEASEIYVEEDTFKPRLSICKMDMAETEKFYMINIDIEPNSSQLSVIMDIQLSE